METEVLKIHKFGENAGNVFLGLDSHIIQKILSYLGIEDRVSLESVCRRLRNISIDTSLRFLSFPKQFDTKKSWKKPKEALLDEFWMRWGCDLCSLNLNFYKLQLESFFFKMERDERTMEDGFLSSIRHTFLPKLVRLKLESPYFTKCTLDRLRGFGPNLRFLSLKHNISLDTSLIKHNNGSNTGHVSGPTTYVKDDLAEFLRNCRNLEIIDVSDLNINDNFHALPKSIRGISIRYSGLGNVAINLRPLKQFPALKFLNIIKHWGLRADHLWAIQDLNLHTLYFNPSFKRHDNNWQTINSGSSVWLRNIMADSPPSKSLETLQMTVYDSFKAISNFSQLKELHLAILHMTQDAIATELDLVLRNCPRLQILNLSPSNINDSCLESIGQHCKQLETLDISGCKYITRDGIVKMLDALLESGLTGKNLTIHLEDWEIETKTTWSSRLKIVTERLHIKKFYEW